MFSSEESVSISPMTKQHLFARVTVTLMRLISDKNPTFFSGFDLTNEIIISSFFTSLKSQKKGFKNEHPNKSLDLLVLTKLCPLDHCVTQSVSEHRFRVLCNNAGITAMCSMDRIWFLLIWGIIIMDWGGARSTILQANAARERGNQAMRANSPLEHYV